MAISIDGFIAKKDGDSDWVSPLDAKNFEQAANDACCVILGRRTFEQYKDDLFPIKGITNIVLTSKDEKDEESKKLYFANSPQEAIKIAEEKGHDQVLLVGGGRTNGSFLKEDLIEQVILTMHPLILGEGIKLFEGVEMQVDLKLQSKEEIGEGLVKVIYTIQK